MCAAFAVIFPVLLVAWSAGTASAQERSIIVKLRSDATPKGAAELVASVASRRGIAARARAFLPDQAGRGVLAASDLGRYVVVTLRSADASQALAAWRAAPEIEEAFENHRYHIDAVPNDSLYAEQWAPARIDAPAAWDITRGDSSITIGVLDTGVDPAHPDLAGAFALNAPEDINHNGRFDPWPSTEVRAGTTGDLDGIDQDGDGFADDVIGYDFVDQTVRNAGDWTGRDAVPDDEAGHGTYVSGVIAARWNNHAGVAGIAPDSRLVELRAFDASGNGEDDDIAAALVYAAERGVRVVNLSFGDYYYSPLLRDAIRYAFRRGVVVVASSGNEGGTEPHYPSGFPEVISVGATDRSDILAPFTTHGSQLSLSAPGVEILTTRPGGGYLAVSGTSFSAPHVSAAAGLLLSLHHGWSPDAVRSALELSADDRGRPGFDADYGAGRLNLRRALEFPGPPEIGIESPESDAGLGGGDVVTVRGSAYSPLLESWQLMIGEGDDPSTWTPLTSLHSVGTLHDSLGAVRAADYGHGTYTLRLIVAQTNGYSTERRVRLQMNPGKPVVRSQRIGNVWRFAERAVEIAVRTDDPSMMTLWLRPAGRADLPYRAVANEPERSGWLRRHLLLVGRDEMERGLPYDAYVVLHGAGADTAMIGAPSAPIEILREPDAFSLTAMSAKAYTLPYGYVLNDTARLFGDGGLCVALNRFDAGTYGRLFVYSFGSGRFTARDSSPADWLPRGFGHTVAGGSTELLVQSRGAGALFTQTAPGGRLLAATSYSDTTSGSFWADALADLDGDGVDEVIARTDNSGPEAAVYYAARRTGEKLERIATLPNPTPPAAGDSRNKYGPPEAAIADFDGDGVPELLVGDDDADFVIYRRTPGGAYEPMWTDVNDGEGGSEFVAAADVNGDGRAEAVVAYHSHLVADTQHELEPPMWTVKVFSFGTDGSPTLVWRDSIAYVRPTLPYLFFSGVAAANLDRRTGAEVVLSLYPSLYVLTWDTSRATLRPFWYHEGVIANRPIIADFDRDGVAELGVGDGRQISFYQINPTFPGLPAPAGFQGWAESDSAVHLDWNAVPGNEFYTLYRGFAVDADRIHFDSVARTSAISIRDTGFRTPGGLGLDRGRLYYYLVTSRNTAFSPDDSLLSNAVAVFTHNPARIIAANAMDGRMLRVTLDVRMKSGLYRPGAFDVRGADGTPHEVESVVAADPFSFIVSLRAPAPGDSLLVRPTGMLRDVFDTPADSSSGLGVAMPALPAAGEIFIATRATLIAGDTIAVDFNAPLDAATAGLIANYVLRPGGTIVSVTIDPANPSRVLLVLRGDYPIGALGVIYTITINGVRSADGRLVNDGAGSVVALAITGRDLDHLSVYPHPFSPARDGHVTFAGLTRAATIRIFTQSGRFIASVKEIEGNGGVEWDGRDASGAIVPPGIYLYIADGIAADGKSYESPPSKIAIIP